MKFIKLNIMAKMNLFHNTGEDAFEFEGFFDQIISHI